MTTPDDLDPGMFIAVTGSKNGDDEFDFYDGEPLKVCAISLPFIAVDDGEMVYAIDARRVIFQKVSRRYARAMRDGLSFSRPRAVFPNESTPPSPYDCPRCGCRMKRRKRAGNPHWMVSCPECSFERKDIP